MGRQELGHTEATDLVCTEDFGHLLVGGEVLFVVGVLKVVLLDVGPKTLGAFSARGLLLTDDFSEFGTELHWLGQTGSFARHVDGYGVELW